MVGGLWGGVFLHLGLSFPSGRLANRLDRGLVIAGYVIFPLAFVPPLMFGAPPEMGCEGCPENLLLIRRDPEPRTSCTAFGALLYLALFVVVLIRAARRWRRAAARAAPAHARSTCARC